MNPPLLKLTLVSITINLQFLLFVSRQCQLAIYQTLPFPTPGDKLTTFTDHLLVREEPKGIHGTLEWYLHENLVFSYEPMR
jgi:hypothetical protein